mmetsp:Transcript_86494/g.197362  ORF Transcript_86494/g.197362 Transcript_86494/m.197362 type:complete len:710 (+) Transcript_86494:986-3115(+)
MEVLSRRLSAALREYHIGGTVGTNLALLRGVVASPHFVRGEFTTGSLDGSSWDSAVASRSAVLLDAAFDLGNVIRATGHGSADPEPEGCLWVRSPMQAQVVSVGVAVGDLVRVGQEIAVLGAMKMEHVVTASRSGRIVDIKVQRLHTVAEDQPLVLVELAADESTLHQDQTTIFDISQIRDDLREVMNRKRLLTDAGRAELDAAFRKRVAERRAAGQRTARENVADLVDSGSFVEVGGLLVAAQRSRRSVEDLTSRTPADGLVAGIGTVNSNYFGKARGRTAVLAYDYTVLAGTQGYWNHRKSDRLIELAFQQKIPVIWLCEGGGGRPGDVDATMFGSTVSAPLWSLLGRLSGIAPMIGLVTGRCFAGNAAILGSCDVIIATKGSNIGMGGPAMIEGGGLGVVEPDEVGPARMQESIGVVDLLVADEAAAVSAAKQYLSYFQGAFPEHLESSCADQRLLRYAVPENRLRAYDMLPIIETIVDTGSWLELRKGYAVGILTGFARIEGRPLGIVANNPRHLGGAIDSDAAMKASRFMALCDAFDIPILFLCDNPGFMVGVESEEQGAVRKMSRMFIVGASLTVPHFSIVTRKAYGLGGQAMGAGAHMGRNAFSVAWPTAEFGGMGIEGAVKLGFRKELDACNTEQEKQKLFDKLVAAMLENGKALNIALSLEQDDVIDPADSRQLIAQTLNQRPRGPPLRWERKRTCVDVW